MECRISNRLALDINYHTQLVSVLFEMRASGEFPTFPFVVSFSVSLTLADSIRDPIARLSFHHNAYSYQVLSRVRYEYILFARPVAPLQK